MPSLLPLPLLQAAMTRWYRAPEVVLTRGDYGLPVDLWGAGCVMGELLGGQVPPLASHLSPLLALVTALTLMISLALVITLPLIFVPPAA